METRRKILEFHDFASEEPFGNFMDKKLLFCGRMKFVKIAVMTARTDIYSILFSCPPARKKDRETSSGWELRAKSGLRGSFKRVCSSRRGSRLDLIAGEGVPLRGRIRGGRARRGSGSNFLLLI